MLSLFRHLGIVPLANPHTDLHQSVAADIMESDTSL